MDLMYAGKEYRRTPLRRTAMFRHPSNGDTTQPNKRWYLQVEQRLLPPLMHDSAMCISIQRVRTLDNTSHRSALGWKMSSKMYEGNRIQIHLGFATQNLQYRADSYDTLMRQIMSKRIKTAYLLTMGHQS